MDVVVVDSSGALWWQACRRGSRGGCGTVPAQVMMQSEVGHRRVCLQARDRLGDMVHAFYATTGEGFNMLNGPAPAATLLEIGYVQRRRPRDRPRHEDPTTL